MTAIYFTDDARANELLAGNDFAMLVGLTLYQQVPVEKAFSGPYVLSDRLDGELDAATIAAMDPDELNDVFREKPALHRFPGSMAKRTQAVAAAVVENYDGDPAGIWEGVADSTELLRRIKQLPGFGDYKARVYAAVLAQQFGIKPDGWEDHLPEWPNISEVTGPEDRDAMKLRKKEWKSAQKKPPS
jgi:uncharacterized HhH-GPD family protein